MLRVLVSLLVLSLCLVSASASDFGLSENDVRAGESINGFPNWGERLMLTWINRARVDPQVEMRACGAACGDGPCYAPVAPLTWTTALNRAARFHADEMQKQRYFGHDSKCTVNPQIAALYPAACDASASCACVGEAATPWMQRVAFFGAQPSGEVIALGADPNQTFYMWLHEQASAPLCGPAGSNIHRWLILASSGGVGLGFNDKNHAAVGNFGPAPAPYRIPSASHYPRQAASVEMWANWFDAAAPRSASVVVDGKCTPMKLTRGSGTNGAWSATVNGVGSGCHRYYFSFIDASGREVTYPATGSLGIGCEDWNRDRTTASCLAIPATPSMPSRRRAAGRR